VEVADTVVFGEISVAGVTLLPPHAETTKTRATAPRAEIQTVQAWLLPLSQSRISFHQQRERKTETIYRYSYILNVGNL